MSTWRRLNEYAGKPDTLLPGPASPDNGMNQFKSLSNPLLILSDAPEALTGLARVARDIASLAATMPEFRVATLGRGATGRSSFPWTQYSYPEDSGGWGEDYLMRVAEDFFRGERGVVFSNWDVSRLGWLSDPRTLPALHQKAYSRMDRRWDLWGYVPVDATGPTCSAYGAEMRSCLRGYDRLIAASEWGQGVLHESGRPDAGWIPHGIWMDRFDKIGKDGLNPASFVKSMLGPPWNNGITLGCNMANQARKDWPVAFECANMLKQQYGNRFLFWAHTNVEINYWNLYALIEDYGLARHIEITKDLTDNQLALRYSACDCTILPSAGEGFGYPIAESMACGTPCVVTDYAAGQEIVDRECRVPPQAMRVDTQYNLRRAVLNSVTFAATALHQIERKRSDWQGVSEQMRARVEHLGWDKLKYMWMRWLKEGLV